MKSTWPHILNLVLILIIVLLLTGIIDTQKPVKLTDQILGFIKESNARAALVVGDDGRVNIINDKAEPLGQCSVGPNGPYPQCKGLGIGGTVLSSELFNILEARGSNCVVVIGGDGQAREYCW